jgi:hypothetical protein
MGLRHEDGCHKQLDLGQLHRFGVNGTENVRNLACGVLRRRGAGNELGGPTGGPTTSATIASSASTTKANHQREEQGRCGQGGALHNETGGMRTQGMNGLTEHDRHNQGPASSCWPAQATASQNSIHSNTGLGIDLGGDGRLNDPLDAVG